jgi:hypothetical protein
MTDTALRDAIREIVVEVMDARIATLIRPLLDAIRAINFELNVSPAPAPSFPRRGPGRPRKDATAAMPAATNGANGATNGTQSVSGPLVAGVRRCGRRSKLTGEQKRARAAAYQKQYRDRKKAEAEAARKN